MREIEFHPGLPDPAAYLQRLLHKACGQGLRVVVTGAPELLSRLDVQLWVSDPGDFLPHARLRAGETPGGALQRTPVWLADDARAVPDAAVLVNLGPAMPQGHAGFGRVVELVGQDDDAAQAGRERWRAYLAAGDTPVDVRKRAANRG